MRAFKLTHEPDVTIGMNLRKKTKVCYTEEIAGQMLFPVSKEPTLSIWGVEAGGGNSN